MNQYTYNGWIIEWEGEHQDYHNLNKFVLLDKDMGQLMIQVTFLEDEIEFKSALVDHVKVNIKDKKIIVSNFMIENV